jgi:hypothetical protein
MQGKSEGGCPWQNGDLTSTTQPTGVAFGESGPRPSARARIKVRHRDDFPVLPGALPGVGHQLVFRRNPLGAFKRAYESIGPIVWIDFGFGHQSFSV